MVYKKPNNRSKITQKSKAAIDLDQNRKTNTKPLKLKINTFPYHHISAVVRFFTRSINLVRILCIFVKPLTRNLMHFSAIKLKDALIKECWQRSVLAHVISWCTPICLTAACTIMPRPIFCSAGLLGKEVRAPPLPHPKCFTKENCNKYQN